VIKGTLRGAVAAALFATMVSGLPGARAAHPRASVTLNMWGWADRNLCAQDFQKTHAGITVKYTTENTPLTKLNVLKRGGSAFPDVVFDNIEYGPNYYQLGFYTDLSDVVPADVHSKYAPGSLGPLTLNGKLVGVPHDEAAIGIWYNVNTIKKAGLSVPHSYDQVYADAAKLAKQKQYYISWFGADSWSLVTLAWANHANWFTLNKDGSWTVNIDTPLTEKLATQYVAGVRSGGILPDDPFGPVSGKAYAQGKVAYAVGPNWLGHYGIEPGYPKQKGQWTFMATLPSVGWWGGGAFYVPAQSAHLTEAKQLAVYCSTSPVFQHQVETVPSYTGVYNVAGAFTPDPYYVNPTSVIQQLKLSTTHTATGWTWSPNQSYVDTQTQTAMSQMINGANVHSTLQHLQSQIISNLKLQGISVK
jgi:ABC-type glycerol-3-phosphate transport system substrate-binding protein